jgi:hypothetical protein
VIPIDDFLLLDDDLPSPKKRKVSFDLSHEATHSAPSHLGSSFSTVVPVHTEKTNQQIDGASYLKSLLSKPIESMSEHPSHSYRLSSIRQQRVLAHIPQLQPKASNPAQLSEDDIREIERQKQEEAKALWEKQMYEAAKSRMSDEAIDRMVRKPRVLWDYTW